MSCPTNKLLADRVRTARIAAGLSQSELARQIGTKPQAIQAIESGSVNKTRYAVAIAAATGTNPAWIADGAGPMHPSEKTPESLPNQASPAQPVLEELGKLAAANALDDDDWTLIQTLVRRLARAHECDQHDR